ncbi:MAG: thioredoxin family protein [Planctomycetota bacterium]|jgi:thioredoxin-related protein|nr:thioredoxin family protein [Planctomycetota bacterium]
MNIRRQLLVIMGLILSLNSGSLSLAQESEKAQKKAPPVYDTEADAAADIAAAVERAKKEHKRVLVVYGGNWCGWCVKLDEFFKKDRTVSRTIRYEYEVVKVDIGKFDKNIGLVDGYGAMIKKKGVPYITVLDGDGKVVAHQNTGDLEEGDHHDSVKVEKFLQAQKSPPVDAEQVLATALKQASKDGRKILLHLGAPW